MNHLKKPPTHIHRLSFGIWSPTETTERSVAEINSPKLTGDNMEGTVYDPRLGSMDPHHDCVTCGRSSKNCPGHFGHINLNHALVHPLHHKHVLHLLRVICVSPMGGCNKVLIKKDVLELKGILKLQGRIRFKRLLNECEKTPVCMHCEQLQPKITFSPPELTYHMSLRSTDSKDKMILDAPNIAKIFENITPDMVRLFGFSPERVHPKSLVLTVLPVLPPVDRPPVAADGLMCDDDLTIQYIEIVKLNEHLKNPTTPQNKIAKYQQSLGFRIKCLFDNSQNKAKHTNGRPFKGIKKRIAGKEGLVRSNLMGKRVEQAARTVIGADPTLPTGVVAIPPHVARTLSIDVYVNRYNKDILQALVDEGKCNTVTRNEGTEKETRRNLKFATRQFSTPLHLHDDIVHEDGTCTNVGPEDQGIALRPGDIIMRKEKTGEEPKAIPTRIAKARKFPLEMGDKVARQLQDGDIVLLNRQPTLHQGSMLAHTIRIIEGKTFRFNLATTSPFNADFDGDEMNIHVPQNPQAQAELHELSHPRNLLVSAQSGKTNIKIVQDSLVGAYKMTLKENPMSKARFFQLCAACQPKRPGTWDRSDWILKKIRRIKRVCEKKKILDVLLVLNPKEPGPCAPKIFESDFFPYTGKGMISMLLPDDFFYTKKSKFTVVIEEGVMISGALTKSDLGGGHGSILKRLAKEYGPDRALEFIDNVQFVTNNWLLCVGFTVGIKDCIATNKEVIRVAVKKAAIEASVAADTTADPFIREAKINAALSKARDVGLKMAKDALDADNNFVSTVMSGSKGDWFNIGQIGGLLGQQNFSGGRIVGRLNGGKRPTVHYPFGPLPPEVENESRGFVDGNFYEGLNPRQVWMHAITGREGVTDTAMKTAATGYIQRKLVKVSEDVAVRADGTVRNSNGHIIQYVYGGDGLDPKETVLIDSKPAILDIRHLARRLNYQAEERQRIHEKWLRLLNSVTKKDKENFLSSDESDDNFETSESDDSEDDDSSESEEINESEEEESVDSDQEEIIESEEEIIESDDEDEDEDFLDEENYSDLEDEEW